MGQVEWARDLARQLLEGPLPRRWAHTQGVARQAETLRPILGDDAELLVSAAWLHDVGYSPRLVATGFHPLDGGRYLRDTAQADPRVCRLVAHHSCALVEAQVRGMVDELLREFAPEREDLDRALTYCDMTIGPDGSPVDFEDRLSEIVSRYGEHHLVSRSIRQARPLLMRSVQATRMLLPS